jgi:hypothetical protein
MDSRLRGNDGWQTVVRVVGEHADPRRLTRAARSPNGHRPRQLVARLQDLLAKVGGEGTVRGEEGVDDA